MNRLIIVHTCPCLEHRRPKDKKYAQHFLGTVLKLYLLLGALVEIPYLSAVLSMKYQDLLG